MIIAQNLRVLVRDCFEIVNGYTYLVRGHINEDGVLSIYP